MAEKQEDLLKSTLKFTKFMDTGDTNFPIFTLVRDGRITAINDYFQTLQQRGSIDEIIKVVNSKDKEGKTPLQYACYSNLVMYLLMKGADPYQVSNSGKNSFHICTFMGHKRCAEIIYNHERHLDRIELMMAVKQEMNAFKFKKTDVKFGELVSADRHVRAVQERFSQFKTIVYEITRNFLDSWIEKFKKAVGILDELNRNPIHYAAISKFTKCGQVSEFLLKYNIVIPGYEDFQDLFNEVQLLELNKEKRIDPRQYMPALLLCENFLLKEEYSYLVKTFNNAIKKLRQEIINEQDNDGYSPLHLASFNGDFSQVQFYLKNGGNPKSVDLKHKKEVLDFAESNAVRKYLIDLKDAARKGDKKSMNLLVNCGHNLNEKKTIFGVAPVHTSVEYFSKSQNDEALKYVIKCDADLDLSDSNGWTALHHACKNGDLPVCEQLIENYANVNKFSNKGYYPIHVAALYDNPHIIEYLVSKQANLEVQDNQKCTPLILAAKKGNVKSVEKLLNLGANIYAAEIRSFTALHYATFNYHSETVYLLCKYDADFEKLRYMTNSKGQVAKNLVTNSEILFALNTLWHASGEGNLDIVRKLTMLGHNINEQTRRKKLTPLIIATVHEHLLIIQYLLENGADPDIQDSEGKTAKEYAYQTNKRKIIALFESDDVEAVEQEVDQE